MTFVAWVALVAGVGIVVLWAMLLVTRKVPEVDEGDRAIWFHLGAELLLGSALAASGTMVLVAGDDPSARILLAAALGGTVYSAINSAGYYARTRDWGIVAGFAVVASIAIASLAVVIAASCGS